MKTLRTVVALTVMQIACAGAPDGEATEGGALEAPEAMAAVPFPPNPAEPRLTNLRKLTHGGQNAEAYWSPDGRHLIFQVTDPPEIPCDQIYVMAVDGTDVRRVSTGEGRTTCAYFFPSGQRIVYSSTHEHAAVCPAPPDMSRGYVWGLYEFDIYAADVDGSNLTRLTDTPGYDAEATISADGNTIVFTSVRDGDLDIYTMNADGSNVRRLTDTPGYDGGAFFSPDGTKIVYRAHHPTDDAALADFRALLAEGLVRPGVLAVWVMDVDGGNKRMVTDETGANFAPFFHPSGEKIIFSSNRHDPTGRNFDLYMINIDGTGLERITVYGEFDGFPMFSPDGTKLVFSSNRGGSEEGETNVFIADWVENLESAQSR
jgi:Tol biopolymer transport system component